MILVGNQRGNAKNLALHLLKDENERVEVHDLRGFCSDNLVSALNESYAMSRATKCKQHLFSLSLNPPKGEDVSNEQFEDAISKVEEKLGLSGQPRAIVFHEKEGRRHCHAVWSRIDMEELKAVQLSYSKNKLQEVSRELYLEHGWKMPRGLTDKSHSDPRNFTLAEWQQAKRAGKDAKKTKIRFQDAWAISDSKAAFSHALEERGYKLARGDRGFVAVDHQGEVYAVSRWTGVKAKQVNARLGALDGLPTVSEAKTQFSQEMQRKMQAFEQQVEHEKQEKARQAEAERKKLEVEQQAKREALAHAQRLRQIEEAQERLRRLRTGLRGLLDRITGERKRTLKRNALEQEEALRRDKLEKERVAQQQQAMQDRQRQMQQQTQTRLEKQKQELQQDTAHFQELERTAEQEAREEFVRKRKPRKPRQRNRGPTMGR